MQIVDVLGDDSRNLPGLVERGQRLVAAAGFCTAELLFHDESPPPAFVPRLLARQEVAALDRNAGAGKRHHRAGLLDHVTQLTDTGLKIGRDHCYIVPDAAGWRPKAK